MPARVDRSVLNLFRTCGFIRVKFLRFFDINVSERGEYDILKSHMLNLLLSLKGTFSQDTFVPKNYKKINPHLN